jgi:hypothetical protein
MCLNARFRGPLASRIDASQSAARASVQRQRASVLNRSGMSNHAGYPGGSSAIRKLSRPGFWTIYRDTGNEACRQAGNPRWTLHFRYIRARRVMPEVLTQRRGTIRTGMSYYRPAELDKYDKYTGDLCQGSPQLMHLSPLLVFAVAAVAPAQEPRPGVWGGRNLSEFALPVADYDVYMISELHGVREKRGHPHAVRGETLRASGTARRGSRSATGLRTRRTCICRGKIEYYEFHGALEALT